MSGMSQEEAQRLEERHQQFVRGGRKQAATDAQPPALAIPAGPPPSGVHAGVVVSVRERLRTLAAQKEAMKADNIAAYQALIARVGNGEDVAADEVLKIIEAADVPYSKFEDDLRQFEEEANWKVQIERLPALREELAGWDAKAAEFMPRREEIEGKLRVEGAEIGDNQRRLKEAIHECEWAERRLGMAQAKRDPNVKPIRSNYAAERLEEKIRRAEEREAKAATAS